MVATAHRCGIRLWNVHKNKVVQSFDSLVGPQMRFSPDSRFLLTVSSPKPAALSKSELQVWAVGSGRCLHTLPEENGPFISICPAGTLLAICSVSGVTFCDWKSGRRLSEPQIRLLPDDMIVEHAFGRVPRRLVFSPDARVLAGTTFAVNDMNPAKIYLWEAATGRLLQRLQGLRDYDGEPVFSPDGRLLVACGTTADISDRRKITDPQKEQDLYTRRNIIMRRGDPLKRALVVWELASGREAFRIEREWCDSRGLEFALSPDGRLLVMFAHLIRWDEIQEIRVWDARTGELLHHQETSYPLDGPQPLFLSGLTFTPDSKQVAAVGGGRVLFWDMSAFNRPLPKGITPPVGDLAPLWTDLAADDIKTARRAVWSLVAAGPRAVPFLRDRLRPVAGPDPHKIARLITELEDNDFATRERAEKELERLGDFAVPAMQKSLQDKPPPETRKRLEGLLARSGRPITSAERLRTLRAQEVLEHLASDEARAILRTMAGGAPGASETEDARAALQRLDRRPARR
jgi:WD40 repeat protein